MDAINKGDARICLMTTAVGGFGIELTAANHVIFLQQSWNATTEDQASARAHRKGQKKEVYVWHLIYQGTVEQEQYKRQIEKKWNSKALLLANPPEKPIELLERNKLYRVDQLEEDYGEVLQSIREFKPGNFN